MSEDYFVDVLLPVSIKKILSYTIKKNVNLEIKTGDLVKVPFKKKDLIGVILETYKDKKFNGDIKNIKKKYNINLGPMSCEFMLWVSNYTLNSLNDVLKLALNGYRDGNLLSIEEDLFVPYSVSKKDTIATFKTILSKDQLEAFDKLNKFLFKDFNLSPILLEGITGSGKTKVFLKAAVEVINNGGQVLVLFPEISLLTHQIKNIFDRDLYGITPLVWHSRLSIKNRHKIWYSIIKNSEDSKLIMGSRSALFLPFQNLKLIIVDEEHDSSYKQEENITYNARDMAIVRSKLLKIPIILSSATPSLETKLNVLNKKYNYVELKNKYWHSGLPKISLVDMRLEKNLYLSGTILKHLKETFKIKQQSLIFINKRGYAPLIICENCKYQIKCPNCSFFLVEHKINNFFLCHYCNFKIQKSNTCPNCKTDNINSYGIGAERIQEIIYKLIPDARTILLTSDTLSSEFRFNNFINKIINHEIDIIIGTQIVSKCYNFPLLTMVGIINVDFSFNNMDIRINERIFQMLCQISGRVRRDKLYGHVFIQTYNPSHSSLKALHSGDWKSFYFRELEERKKYDMPPYSRLATITISGTDNSFVENMAIKIFESAPKNPKVIVLGPSQSFLFKLNKKYRWKILLKFKKDFPIQFYIKSWISQFDIRSSKFKILINIDPYNFNN